MNSNCGAGTVVGAKMALQRNRVFVKVSKID
uniref:Uncharacterized protein n=1 Tax=Anguilla anguilla TaxID=7936 RepID=A0A0E9TE10_ANGAN